MLMPREKVDRWTLCTFCALGSSRRAGERRRGRGRQVRRGGDPRNAGEEEEKRDHGRG
jgi:hypothetical protein